MSEPVFRLGVMAIDGCMLSSIASATDSLRVANTLVGIRHPGQPPRMEVLVFNAHGQDSARTSTGLVLGGQSPIPEHLDLLLIPGLHHHSPRHLAEVVADMHAEKQLLRDLHLRGTRIAGSCSGGFLLAEAGLLDGHRATCSWWLTATFRQRYPDVQLEADAMVVEDGTLLTAGGASSIQVLMLRLIGQILGEEMAQMTARLLLIDPERQSQAPYVSQALLERPRHSLPEKAEHFLQQELHQEISVGRLAEICGVSERSLLRHFRSHLGVSPLEHIQNLRVERAKALLESTHMSFDEIVERCGYSDSASFRKLFKRATAMTPGDYRERYTLRPH